MREVDCVYEESTGTGAATKANEGMANDWKRAGDNLTNEMIPAQTKVKPSETRPTENQEKNDESTTKEDWTDKEYEAMSP